MIYGKRLKYSCDTCVKGHRARDCVHFERFVDGVVYVIKDRGRPGRNRSSASVRERFRLVDAKLHPTMNIICERTGHYRFFCKSNCCPRKEWNSVFLDDESLVLRSVLDGFDGAIYKESTLPSTAVEKPANYYKCNILSHHRAASSNNALSEADVNGQGRDHRIKLKASSQKSREVDHSTIGDETVGNYNSQLAGKTISYHDSQVSELAGDTVSQFIAPQNLESRFNDGSYNENRFFQFDDHHVYQAFELNENQFLQDVEDGLEEGVAVSEEDDEVDDEEQSQDFVEDSTTITFDTFYTQYENEENAEESLSEDGNLFSPEVGLGTSQRTSSFGSTEEGSLRFRQISNPKQDSDLRDYQPQFSSSVEAQNSNDFKPELANASDLNNTVDEVYDFNASDSGDGFFNEVFGLEEFNKTHEFLHNSFLDDKLSPVDYQETEEVQKVDQVVQINQAQQEAQEFEEFKQSQQNQQNQQVEQTHQVQEIQDVDQVDQNLQIQEEFQEFQELQEYFQNFQEFDQSQQVQQAHHQAQQTHQPQDDSQSRDPLGEWNYEYYDYPGFGYSFDDDLL